MNEYISREAFVRKYREGYCENCDRRKGMKNGELRFVYDIGDAPCRACDIGDMLDAVDDFPATDVVEVVRCRECFRYDPETHYCENTGCECDPWEFCSDGERKDGADNG